MFSLTRLWWGKTSSLGKFLAHSPSRSTIENWLINKPRLVALIECADNPAFQCSQLVVFLDRSINASEISQLVRDLRWVGFELATLGPWAEGGDQTSEDWLVLAMEM